MLVTVTMSHLMKCRDIPSLSLSSDIMEGGQYRLSSGRNVVNLTVDTTERADAGYWNCTAQVYENGTDSLRVGEAVMRSIQLVVVGEFQRMVRCQSSHFPSLTFLPQLLHLHLKIFKERDSLVLHGLPFLGIKQMKVSLPSPSK